jgi:heterodisulfide reductase subunit A
VVIARDYKFMCSSLGQELIRRISKKNTDAWCGSCSPHLHECDIRNACGS